MREAAKRLVLRVGFGALLASLCVPLGGCSLVKKLTKNQHTEPHDNIPPPQFPTGGAPRPVSGGGSGNSGGGGVTPTNGVTNPGNQGAILAGRVMDGNFRPPANTSIRWVNLDDQKDAESEASVTPEGYFTIVGLKEGHRYKLVARGKQGERIVAGAAFVTAPNSRVFVQVKEEFAGSAGGGSATVDDPSKTSGLGTKQNPAGWTAGPLAVIPGRNANEPDLPMAINVGQARLPQGNPAQHWTPAPGQKPSAWPPVLEIPRTKAPPPPLQIPNQAPAGLNNGPAFPPAVKNLLDRALVPSCVRVGDRIENFALNEPNGQRWEFRHRKSKLVLVDFWRTDCVPCLNSLPFLTELQRKYGPHGLEVIGIAAEPVEQAHHVMNVCKKYGVNYRQLLSTSADCPVRNEFRVTLWPTLVLIDDQGRIVWRANGPTPEEKAVLERAIQQRLSARSF
ncbi:MAG: TlpA family protein disulfide reductase [Gemmataceae bacterium]|nr:TlpA family protein disulfide reductase [Gemmataceae bacterium]